SSSTPPVVTSRLDRMAEPSPAPLAHAALCPGKRRQGRRALPRALEEGITAVYLARFSYDVLPVNRQRAIEFIRREVEAARSNRLNARLLVPLTRGHGDGVALQFEVELTKLDQLDQFRQRGIGSREETGNWMHAFSEVLTAPPHVEILHVDQAKA